MTPGQRGQKPSLTDKQVNDLHRMVLDDRRLTVGQLVKTMDISSGSIRRVLSDILGMSKLSATLVLRMLSPEQKPKRADISRPFLTRFQSDPEDFHHRLVTQDETWVHHDETLNRGPV